MTTDANGYLATATDPANQTTQFTYSTDGLMESMTDARGYLLSTVTYPQGAVTRTYSPTTGQLLTLAAPSGETLTYRYDGFLRTGLTWSGLVSGTVKFGFDSDFRLVSTAVNGQSVALGYDADSLLTSAGSLTLSRNPQNGLLEGTTLGAVVDTYGYDGNGRLASYSASYASTLLYSDTHDERRSSSTARASCVSPNLSLASTDPSPPVARLDPPRRREGHLLSPPANTLRWSITPGACVAPTPRPFISRRASTSSSRRAHSWYASATTS